MLETSSACETSHSFISDAVKPAVGVASGSGLAARACGARDRDAARGRLIQDGIIRAFLSRRCQYDPLWAWLAD